MIFSIFSYITKYWNSDRIEFRLKNALCLSVIRGVRIAVNVNLTESKFKNFYKKSVRDILFYHFLPHVINRDIFITPPYLLEPHVINGRPLRTLKDKLIHATQTMNKVMKKKCAGSTYEKSFHPRDQENQHQSTEFPVSSVQVYP